MKRNAFIMVVLHLYVKRIGMHDTVASLLFLIIPACFVVLNIINFEWQFEIASLSLSTLIIYIMLQKDRTDEMALRETVSAEMAHKDELTGVLNRLAYSEMCDSLLQSKRMIGVVFSDINGLKYTNDHLGHKAGDQLIRTFADCLLNNFRKDEVFRISGDEFVIIIPNIPENIFNAKIDKFMAELNKNNDPAASVGYTYGAGAKIETLVDLAEQSMYKNKELYYTNHGDRKRS